MTASADAPRWSVGGLIEGMRLTLVLLPGCVAMAMAVGTLSAQKGLSLAETVMMNGVLYAGASQLVALEIWTPRFTLGSLVTVALVAATVNLRYLLMTASMRPWLAGIPAWQVYPALMFTVDANWLVAMRYHSDGGRDPSIFLGSGLILWVCWVAGAIPGHLLGRMVSDPARLGLRPGAAGVLRRHAGPAVEGPALGRHVADRRPNRARGIGARPRLVVYHRRLARRQHRRRLYR